MLKTASLATAMMLLAGASSAFEAQLETNAPDKLRKILVAASAAIEADTNDIKDVDEIIAAVQSDYRNLIGALYRQGYYAPVISIKIDGREASDLSLVSLPAQVQRTTITVTTGPKFKFGTLKIAPLAPGTELPEFFARGEVAKSARVGEAKDAAIDAWRQASHAKAALSGQEILADHPNRRLDVALAISPGPALRFGEMRFEGESKVKPKRLERIANLPTGRDFDPDTIDLVRKRLQKTGTFRSISLREAETANPDGSLDIIANLTDQKRRRMGFGAEVSSTEGGTLSAYWMHRNITRHADRLRFDAEISGLGGNYGTDYTISVTYRRPATVSRKTTLVASAEVERLDEPDFRLDRGEFTLGADVESSENSTFYAAIGYRYSEVEDAFGHREFRHVILPMEGSRSTRDNDLDPKTGTYIEAEIMPFLGVNGSASGARLYGDGRAYFTFGADEKFTLAGRVQLGSVAGADLTEVPPDLLFFSGGGGTVRGQPYDSLGVTVDEGPTGGSSFLGASAELRARVRDKISVVGFADIGGIGATALPGEAAEWHSGAGIGLRYHTSFGPIRFDLATPVSGNTGNGVQIYIGIGQAF